MKARFSLLLAGCLSLLAVPTASRAQWLTQDIHLTNGWNAVFLHVDASHASLNDLVGATMIDKVWEWRPRNTTAEFVQSPQEPVEQGSHWVSWKKNDASSQLQNLRANTAYLVHTTANYMWGLKGKPVPPRYDWTTSGLNLVGFPTRPDTPPKFSDFFNEAVELQQGHEVYHYPGGPLGAGNPARLFNERTLPVSRGHAYWIKADGVYNRFYGVIEIVSASSTGLNFSDQIAVLRLRVRNHSKDPLDVTMTLIPSEPSPTGETFTPPPLVVRGPLNTTDLTYAYETLATTGKATYELPQLESFGQPGSETELVIGLDRAAITAPQGSTMAGILQLTDHTGHWRVDLPVTAQTASSTGLWVGVAHVSAVGQYLKTYAKDADGKPIAAADGSYTPTVNTNLAAVPRTFPLRLIVHNPDSGGMATLLQRAYVGFNSELSQEVTATTEAALGRDQVENPRRISASHLPWTRDNSGWPFNAALARGNDTFTAEVTLNHDNQASNPFLHTYHPDHDNLDAAFKNAAPRGSESFKVVRTIRLQMSPQGTGDFASRTTGGLTLSGNYAETIKVEGGGVNARTFEVLGAFSLNRMNNSPTLATDSPSEPPAGAQ